MSPLVRWFASLRPFSFPASIMPVLLAAGLATGRGTASWWLLPLYLLAAVLFHAGTNVLNDYYDFRHGVDGPDDRDPTHTLTQGVVTPRFMLVTGNLYFVLGLLLGTGISLVRGPLFFAFGLAGAAGAYFYTGARFSLKYQALGDLTVFLLMGPALVLLGEWALTGTATPRAALACLPQAFLVTAILHGNNLRDLRTDASAGVSTVAGLLGDRGSRLLLATLFVLALASQIALAAFGLVPPLSLIALAGLAPAVLIVRTVFHAEDAADLLELPKWCAGIHLLHGLLYGGAILIAAL